MSKPDSATDLVTHDGEFIVTPKDELCKSCNTLVSWSSSLLFRIMSDLHQITGLLALPSMS